MRQFLNFLEKLVLKHYYLLCLSAFSVRSFNLLTCPARIHLNDSSLFMSIATIKSPSKLDLDRFTSPPLHFPLKINVISPDVFQGGEVQERNLVLCLLRGRNCWKVYEHQGLLQMTVLYVQFFQNELDCSLTSISSAQLLCNRQVGESVSLVFIWKHGFYFIFLSSSLKQNSGIEKAFLFDVVSKIYIATDSTPVDMQTYELCCDMIDVVIDISCIYG